MIPYGFARVADSLAQNGSSGTDPLHKPVIGRAMLASCAPTSARSTASPR
jgi:hypothetical protein